MTALLIAPAGIDVEVWATEIIRHAREDLGGLLSVYGSPEWRTADAPHRWASAVAAAETRRRENTTEAIATHLAHELWLERLKLLEDEHYTADAAAWKRHWGDPRWLTHRRRVGGPEAGQIALAWAHTHDAATGAAGAAA